MRLSKDELLAKINERVTDSDIAIELMEDISDSFSDAEVVDDSEKATMLAEIDELKATTEELNTALEEMKEKYKARFLSNEGIDEPKSEVDDEPNEEEIIDIKDI